MFHSKPQLIRRVHFKYCELFNDNYSADEIDRYSFRFDLIIHSLEATINIEYLPSVHFVLKLCCIFLKFTVISSFQRFELFILGFKDGSA